MRHPRVIIAGLGLGLAAVADAGTVPAGGGPGY